MRNKSLEVKPKYIMSRKVVFQGTKKVAHGTWKLAYADFITALMSFFLLMWLLNASSNQQLEGISSYFRPTLSLSKEHKQQQHVEPEDRALSVIETEDGKSKGFLSQVNTISERAPQKLHAAEREILEALDKDVVLGNYKENITLEQSQEGLMIQIKEGKNRGMFQPGKAELSESAKLVLERISKLIQHSHHLISIGGYTTRVMHEEDQSYTAWELSSERANAARRCLINNGIAPDRIARIAGYADSAPLNALDPDALENMRVTIMLLKSSSLPSYRVPLPRDKAD